MGKCKFNGLGCGYEDKCTKSQDEAENGCGVYLYLKYLDETFDGEKFKHCLKDEYK